MVYSISYDLNNPSEKCKKLHHLIIGISKNNWVHALDSTYIIKSDKSAEEIYERLSYALDSNDLIFVSELAKNFSGYLKMDLWKPIEHLFY